MRRADLEHVVAAAAQIVGEDEFVVVGSQAILGGYPDAPASLLRSQEADPYPQLAGEGDQDRWHHRRWFALPPDAPHDLVLSELAADRERDWDFAKDALAARLVDPETLVARASDLPVDPVARRYRIFYRGDRGAVARFVGDLAARSTRVVVRSQPGALEVEHASLYRLRHVFGVAGRVDQ